MASAVNIPTLFTMRDKRKEERLEFVENSKQEWAWAFMFILSMAMLGLKFPLAIVFTGIIMLNRLAHNMYDFIIMFTIFCGGYGFLDDNSLPVKTHDIAMLSSLGLLLLYRKPLILKLSTLYLALYAFVIIIIASFSQESLTIQFRNLRAYFHFAYFIVPIALFSGREFRFEEFCRKIVPYAIIICIFYIIDGYILNGNFLVPRTSFWKGESTFFNPIIQPLSFTIHRKYPPGLYLLILCLLPSIYQYRFRRWQWIAIILALICSKTFTVITGFIIAYFIFQKSYKKILTYGLIAFSSFIALYAVDSSLPVWREGDMLYSTLRIKSSIDQFMSLKKASDDQDFANFGSGRLAQLMPNLEIIDREDRWLTGLGFLHQDYTKIKKYQITNEFYTDNTANEEVAGKVEIIPLQIFLNVGILGLIAHCLFLWALYRLVRNLRHARYFTSVLFCLIWFGLGGFAGLISFHGSALLALAFSVIVLDNRENIKGFSTPWIKKKVKDFNSRAIWGVNK